MQFKARGGSPEGRALLFPSVGVGKEGSQAAGSPASSLPILSFSSSEGNGKMRRKGSDWSVSSREGVSRNRVLDSFGVHQKVKGHSCALRGVLMLSAPERSLKSITNVN